MLKSFYSAIILGFNSIKFDSKDVLNPEIVLLQGVLDLDESIYLNEFLIEFLFYF